MKRTVMGGLLAAGTLLGGLALTGTANAIVVSDNDQPETEVCYVQVPFQEYQFRKTVTTPAIEEDSHVEYRWDIETRTETFKDVIEKETRTRTWTDGVWQNFSPNKDQGAFEGPPSWPTDSRGTWQHTNKPIPPGQQGPDGVYQNGEGNGSWFYRAAGFWSDWGPWTDWPGAGPLVDDGRARGPLPHGSGEGWERQYRYVVVGQSSTGFTNWVPAGSTPWGPNATPPAGTNTTRYVNKQQTTVIDVEYVPAFDTTHYYNDGAVSTTDENIWTTDQPLDRSWEKFREQLSYKAGDRIPCDEKPEDYTTKREVSAPCTVVGQTTTEVTVYTQDWTYELNDDSEWLPVKDGDEDVATYVRDLTVEEEAGCPTPTPTPTPTPEPPGQAQLPPPPPPPPAAVAAAPAAPAPAQLPSTGTSSWAIALIALACLAGGTGLMRLSRRPTD